MERCWRCGSLIVPLSRVLTNVRHGRHCEAKPRQSRRRAFLAVFLTANILFPAALLTNLKALIHVQLESANFGHGQTMTLGSGPVYPGGEMRFSRILS